MSQGNAALFFDRFGVQPEELSFDDLTPHQSAILSRRTHRTYDARAVPAELVDKLLAIAFSASSKSDFQQASVITVDAPDTRTALAAHFPAMPWIGSSPRFLVFCGDTRRLEQLGQLRGHSQSNRNIEGFLNAAVDAALVMQTFILAAEDVGLGCCPISVLRNTSPEVAQLLALPDGVFVVAGLCLGYPASIGHISMRLPMDVTVHRERYDDVALASQVEAYDARREARHGTPVEKQRNAGRFGIAHPYGWSEDKTRQAAEPEGTAFARHLIDTGFSFERP